MDSGHRLPDRGTAIVTGARRGIGAAAAAALASAGFTVVIVDLVADEAAEATVAKIKAEGGRVSFLRADVGDLDEHPRIVEAAKRFGPISCLVNNAGVNVPVRGDMLETTPEVLDAVVGVNLRGTFFLTQAVAREMVADPVPSTPRSVIVVSSANAAMVSPEKAAYCLSKSALSMLTALFAARLADNGIDVFEVRPGLIKTEMSRKVWDSYGDAIKSGVSLTRRWGESEDVGQVIGALASGALPFCTGTVVPVGGGLHVHRL
jgi:NAD(P)-dependent dehydrogenase (short-subunit alcohol dehydrogenase family)